MKLESIRNVLKNAYLYAEKNPDKIYSGLAIFLLSSLATIPILISLSSEYSDLQYAYEEVGFNALLEVDANPNIPYSVLEVNSEYDPFLCFLHMPFINASALANDILDPDFKDDPITNFERVSKNQSIPSSCKHITLNSGLLPSQE